MDAIRKLAQNPQNMLCVSQGKLVTYRSTEIPFWGVSSNLNSACKHVNNISLNYIDYFRPYNYWGLKELQKRILHYSSKHSLNKDMLECEKRLHTFLKTQYFLEKIIRFTTKILTLNSKKVGCSTKKVPIQKLPSVDDVWYLSQRKKTLYKKVLEGQERSGDLEVQQYNSPALTNILSTRLSDKLSFCSKKSIYKYNKSWNSFDVWVNFADPLLGGGWKTDLFAQEELLVAEHPDLGLVSDYLGRPRTTKWITGSPTPILVKNIKRYAKVSGIYGHQFHQTEQSKILNYVSRLWFPSKSNILCMAAPNMGVGAKGCSYSNAEIKHLFLTSYTAFKGAKTEAELLKKPLNINTGNWGCGAFGNNPTLIAIIQLLAADAAGVDNLTYHTVDNTGQKAFDAAKIWINNFYKLNSVNIEDALVLLQQHHFLKGESNGT